MNKEPEVYLFGQVLGTHSFLLKDGFLNSTSGKRLRKLNYEKDIMDKQRAACIQGR